MDVEQTQLKLFTFKIAGGSLDDVTGEAFGPTVSLKFCNQSMSKFFNVRITDMFAMPMVVFVSGHDYKRPDKSMPSEEYDPYTSLEMFRRRVNENCERMCREIETAFQNLQCETCHTGLLVQSDSQSLYDVFLQRRLHKYSYGTLITLRICFNNAPHVMDLNTYKLVYKFINENGARGLYQVHDTLSMENYILESIKLEHMSRSILQYRYFPREYHHTPNDYALGYRTHSVDLYTSCARIDKFEYEDIIDGDTVEYDYESWLETLTFQFNNPTWPLPTRDGLSAVTVEFSIVLKLDGTLADINVKFMAPYISKPVTISYFKSMKTQGSQSLMLFYFINDTHYGLNRPSITNRRAYCSKFMIATQDSDSGIVILKVTKRNFIRKLITYVNISNIRDVLDGKIDTRTGDMFTFDSGSLIEYMDHGDVDDTRDALRITTNYNLPLRPRLKAINKCKLHWLKNVMEMLNRGVFIPAGWSSRNRNKRPENKVVNSWPAVEFNNKAISSIKRHEITACVKYKISPGNVFFVRASNFINMPCYHNILQHVNIYEYDPGAARKYDIPTVYNNSAPGRNSPTGDMIMVVGRRSDTFTEFITSMYNTNIIELDLEFKNTIMEYYKDFKTAILFTADLHFKNSGHRVNDRLCVIHKPLNSSHNAYLAESIRVLATGDVIINGKNLVLNSISSNTTTDPVSLLKHSSVQVYDRLKPETPVCCVRAIAYNWPRILITPVTVDVTIQRCFGQYFAEPSDVKIYTAVANVFKKHKICIGDTVTFVPVLNSLTDEPILIPRNRVGVSTLDFTHHIQGEFTSFINSLFGLPASNPTITNQQITAPVCDNCKNFKCKKKI